ncbi:flowering time control protein FCA-like [Papaver somniferum]|uniref:flowering time control protein FCA-like n=1 Tax=Papaver somniferum TaxID=3469 RepID=UPI000E705B3E|nr:flowering time control protein FCA-like [Papaver somniferum]
MDRYRAGGGESDAYDRRMPSSSSEPPNRNPNFRPGFSSARGGGGGRSTNFHSPPHQHPSSSNYSHCGGGGGGRSNIKLIFTSSTAENYGVKLYLPSFLNGCCFIKYATSEDAERAIRALHNQYTLPGGTGPIQVRYADGDRERLGNYLPNSVYVSFLGCV